MSNFCAVIPQVYNKEGDLVDSKLFTDLLAYTKNNRDEAKRYYVFAMSNKNNFADTNELGEPDLKTVVYFLDKMNKDNSHFLSAKELLDLFPNADANEALQVVIDNSTKPFVQQIAGLLQANLDKLPNSTFVVNSDFTSNWLGRYYNNNGRVELNAYFTNNLTIAKEDFYAAIVHEYVHAFTLSALDNPTTAEEIEFSKQIEVAYNAYKRTSDSELYGFTNHYEFVAELMSNENFFRSLGTKNQSILQKITNAIKQFLGLKTADQKAVDKLIWDVATFIQDSSNPSLISGNGTVKVLNKRAEGVISQINTYASEKYKNTADSSLPASEIFMLQLHKKIKFKIGSINKSIGDLNKVLKTAELNHARNIRTLYNNGEPTDNSNPNFVNEVSRYEAEIAPVLSEVTDKTNYKNSLNSLLSDLETTTDITQDEANYIKLAVTQLDEIETRLGNYDLDSSEGQKQLAEDYLFTRLVEKSRIPSLQEPASNLSNELLKNISTYISNISEEYLNTSGLANPSINIDDILKNTEDITLLAKVFEGFGDYPRLEAQLIHSITMSGKEKARLDSLKVGQDIVDHMHKLQVWAKSAKLTNIVGKGSIRKAYAKLVEVNHLGRLDLVKPYNTKYYQEVNANFRNSKGTDPKAVAAKKWLSDNYYKKPTSGAYMNPKYAYLQSQPALKEFYEFFKQTMKNNYARLPEYITLNNEEKIPTLIKNSFWEFFSMRKSNIFKSTLTALKTILIGQGRAEFYDEAGDPREKFELAELSGDEIKLRMIGEASADVKSFDLGKVLFEFSSFVNDYSEMMEVLPKVRMIQNIVETKQYINETKNGIFGTQKVTIQGSESNTYKAINMYIQGKIIGTEESPFGRLGGGDIYDQNGAVVGRKSYYASDLLRGLIRYTRTLQLGFNPFSGVNNIFAGLMGDFIEAGGGKYFNKKQLMKAISIYTSNTLVKGSNIVRTDKLATKLNLLSEYIQPLEEIGEWQDKKKIELDSPTLLGSAFKGITDNAFIFQAAGEDFVQKITMIAYLLNKKTPEGIPYWNMVDVENDELKFKDETNFDTKQALLDSRKTILTINHSIHGNYSKDNSSVYDGALVFQAALVFKKWLPYMIRNRFMSKRYNYQTGQTDEGFYLAGAKGIAKSLGHMSDYFKGRFTTAQNVLNKRGALTREESIGIKKIIGEMAMFLLFASVSKILAPPPDEDKDKFWVPNFWEHLDISMWDSKKEFENYDGLSGMLLKSLMDSMNKLSAEAVQMYSLPFYYDAVKPALWSTLTDFWDVIRETFKYLGAEDKESKDLKFKKGPNKGNLRVIKEGGDLIPYYKQIQRAKQNGNKTIEELQK